MPNTHQQSNRRSPLLPPPRSMPMQKLREIIADHEEWVASEGLRGCRAKIINRQLAGSDFTGRNLSRAHIELCDLRDSNFTASHLVGAWLNNCELDKADFSDSIAIGCQFLSSHAPDALFKRADLTDACFMFAKLAAADFSQSNLSRADFENAEFQGANFRGANISGVDLARWHVTAEQLRDAIMDGKTKVPMAMVRRDGMKAP